MSERHKGFTMIELILAITLISMTIVGTASIIIKALDTYGMARQRRDAVQAGRYALDRISRELRQIASPATYILIASGTKFRYATQLVPLQFVEFTFAGGQLTRDSNLLVSNLTGTNGWTYYNAAGLPAAGIADIVRVRITLNADTGVAEYGTVPLQTDIYLRNRYYAGFSQP